MIRTYKRGAALTALIIAVIMSFVALAPIAACGGNTDPGTITLEPTSLALYEGDSETLKPTLSNEEAEVEWITSDANVVTVSKTGNNGRLTAKAAGTATVTARIAEGVEATCAVEVKTRTVTIVDKDSVNTTIELLSDDRTRRLTATVSDGSTPTWSSSAPGVVQVDSTGLVTAMGAGTATVTAKKGIAEDSVTFTVTAPADYYVIAASNNAGVVSDPGRWYYFLKSAHASKITVAEAYYADGITTLAISKAEEGDPDETGAIPDANVPEYALRYQPEFETGSSYSLSFKIKASVAGEISVNNGAVKEDNANPLSDTITVAAGIEKQVSYTGVIVNSTPINIRPFIFSTPADGNLVIQVYDFEVIKDGEAVQPEPTPTPAESYDLEKTTTSYSNVLPGRWYYISGSGTVTEARYENGKLIAQISGATNKETNQNESNQRFVFVPEGGMENGNYKVSFTVEVSAKAEIGYGNSGNKANDGYFSVSVQGPIEANTPTSYENMDYRHGSDKKSDLKPFMIQVRRLEEAGDITIVISNVIITSAE